MADSAPPPKKQWIMNAFSMSSPGHVSAGKFWFVGIESLWAVKHPNFSHVGLWRHPKNRTQEYKNIDYWIEIAKILEEGKFHGLFIADMLGVYDVYKGPGNFEPVVAGAAQFPISDPLLVNDTQKDRQY